MATRTLDLGKRSASSEIFGRPRTLGWPVHAYRVTIPAGNSSERERLNPFERVVLNLLEVTGGLDEDALAAETCIPVDLVRNVIFRLRDRDFIDQDNRLVDSRRAESTEREEKYVTALVFRELVGGRILPFVRILDGGNTLKTKAADERTKLLRHSPGAMRVNPPTPRDVIGAISQMRRRSGRTRTVPLHDQVRIGREPEEYLLECDIVIQIHDADFRIGNPFGDGFSRVLESEFTRLLGEDPKLQQWMMEWRARLAATDNEDRPSPHVRPPFDTTENRRRYANLVRILIPARGEPHRSLSSIYHSLEWALFYVCKSYDIEIAISRLRLENGPDYSRWLSDIAGGLGFDVPSAGFRPPLEGRLIAFREKSQADMETVLTLCLLQAEELVEHPLRRIAATHPDFLVRVRSLKQARDGLGHGREHARGSSGTPLESDTFMREVVHALLPSIRFDASSRSGASASQADRLLDARTSLLNKFGHATFRKLGPSAQQLLLDAELFWLACRDGDDAREFVFNLYSGLQGILAGYLTGLAPSMISEDDYRRKANVRAERAGFGRLPPELETVNPGRIRETMQGSDQSLGASAWGLLLKASDLFLERLALSDPQFLATVANIHATRGHGNEPIPLSKDDVNNLRRSAFASIDALLTTED